MEKYSDSVHECDSQTTPEDPHILALPGPDRDEIPSGHTKVIARNTGHSQQSVLCPLTLM